MKILSIVTMDRATFENGPSPATRERMEALCAQMKRKACCSRRAANAKPNWN